MNQINKQKELIGTLLAEYEVSENAIEIVKNAIDIAYLEGQIEISNYISGKTEKERFFDAVPNISNEYITKQ